MNMRRAIRIMNEQAERRFEKARNYRERRERADDDAGDQSIDLARLAKVNEERGEALMTVLARLRKVEDELKRLRAK